MRVWSKHWSGLQRKNRLTRLLESKRAAGEAILDLTRSNPTRAGFSYPGEAILRALADRRALDYDPRPLGAIRAREAVAGYYADRGRQVDPEDIVLTCGTSESYSHLFQVLTEPGDRVATPAPSYPLFDFLARAARIRQRRYRLEYARRWEIDLDDVARHAAKSRALLLVHPNNPTGSYATSKEMAEVSSICAKHGVALICDEVFFDYRWETEDPGDPLAETEALSFALNGLSKIAGLPQLKLGWIVLRGPRRRKKAARRRLELVADTFLSVGAPVQAAASTLLETRHVLQPQIANRALANLDCLRSTLRGSAAEVLTVEGGWNATVRLPRLCGEEEWVLGLLERRNTLAHPGYFYDFPREAYVVASLLTPENEFRAGVAALLEELDTRMSPQLRESPRLG